MACFAGMLRCLQPAATRRMELQAPRHRLAQDLDLAGEREASTSSAAGSATQSAPVTGYGEGNPLGLTVRVVEIESEREQREAREMSSVVDLPPIRCEVVTEPESAEEIEIDEELLRPAGTRVAWEDKTAWCSACGEQVSECNAMRMQCNLNARQCNGNAPQCECNAM